MNGEDSAVTTRSQKQKNSDHPVARTFPTTATGGADKLVSVIVVSFNTSELLHKCLERLYINSPGLALEVFVVDNDSHDDSVEMVRNDFPRVHLIANEENRGFAAANNQAWQLAKGDYILLLNPDAFICANAIGHAVEFMENTPDCGICGGRLLKPDGTLDPSARKFPNALNKFFTISGLRSRFPHSRFFSGHEFGHIDHDQVMEVDWVPGTFTLYRREMLEKTGLFDERYYIYYEETDLCKTAKKAGWKVYFLPTAEVFHVGGAASKTRKEHSFDSGALQVVKFRMRSEWLYFRKNGGLLSVLANAGAEICWHSLRWLVNRFRSGQQAADKRLQSARLIGEIGQSLKDTHYGKVSPPGPW